MGICFRGCAIVGGLLFSVSGAFPYSGSQQVQSYSPAPASLTRCILRLAGKSLCRFLASYFSSLIPCSWTTFSFEEIYRMRFRGWSGLCRYQCIFTFFFKTPVFTWHSKNAVFPFFLVMDGTNCVMKMPPLVSERKAKATISKI